LIALVELQLQYASAAKVQKGKIIRLKKSDTKFHYLFIYLKMKMPTLLSHTHASANLYQAALSYESKFDIVVVIFAYPVPIISYSRLTNFMVVRMLG
jgi:hypothetical protein